MCPEEKPHDFSAGSYCVGQVMMRRRIPISLKAQDLVQWQICSWRRNQYPFQKPVLFLFLDHEISTTVVIGGVDSNNKRSYNWLLINNNSFRKCFILLNFVLFHSYCEGVFEKQANTAPNFTMGFLFFLFHPGSGSSATASLMPLPSPTSSSFSSCFHPFLWLQKIPLTHCLSGIR